MNLNSLHHSEPGVTGAPSAPASAAEPPPGVNWDSLVDESISDEDLAVLGEGDPAPAVAPPPAVQPPPDVVPPPVAATPVAATAPAPVAPQPPPVAAVAPTPDPAAEARQAEEHRVALRTRLADMYSGELTDEQKTALLTDPATIMPQLLAQAALDGAQMAIRMITPAIPGVIHSVTQQTTAQAAALKSFADAHGDLATPELRPIVMQAAQAVKATGQRFKDEASAMEAVARTARALAGIGPPAARPSTPHPQAPVSMVPHSPVARGAAAPAAPATGAKTVWDEMID